MAEIALAVEACWQGRGIGSRLVQSLAAHARRRGFTPLIAEVRYDNVRMLALLRHWVFPATLRLCCGRIEARLATSTSDAQESETEA